MLKTSKSKIRALMALTVSANLLSQPLLAKAEETDPEALATNQTDTLTEPAPETTEVEAPLATEAVVSEAPVEAPLAEPAPETAPVPQETVVPTEVAHAEEIGQATAQESQTDLAVPTTETATAQTAESATPVETIVSASSAPLAEQATAAQDVIMPTYKYADPTDSYWQRITAMTGLQIPYVIINPSSGSGSARIENFAQQIAANSAAGIKSIGYINTQEFTRSHADLMSEVDNYANFYGSSNIAGIFFDEAEPGERQSDVDYMSGLYQAVKAKYPHMTVMANPGRTVTNAISPYADIWMTRETTADDYLNGYYEQLSDMEKDPASSKRTIHLIHSASPSQYDAIIALSRQRNAGYLMITDTSFLALPTDFESLVNRINSGGNGSAAPASTPAAAPTQTGTSGFFRIPAGERTRASSNRAGNVVNPNPSATPLSLTSLGEAQPTADLTSAELQASSVTASEQEATPTNPTNRSQEDRRQQNDDSQEDRRNGNRRRGDDADDADQGREETDSNNSDSNDSDSRRNRREESQNDTDSSADSNKQADQASDTDQEDAEPSSRQAAAVSETKQTQSQESNNSNLPLILLGSAALIGLGILVGRAVLKPKK